MENTEEYFKDERNSDFFDGFLAIGTLGGEKLLDEPATPTFGMSFGDPAMDNAEVTENDLKLISNELEKFLEAEAKEGHHQPSGRNSDTNTIASTIEAIEGLDAEEDNQPMKFPLQEYLFGSLNEFPETKIAGKKERASLGELFQITEVQDKHSENIHGKEKKQSSSHKSAKHLVKKVLKKIHPSPSSRSSVSGKTEVDSTKKKFQKVWLFLLCFFKTYNLKCLHDTCYILNYPPNFRRFIPYIDSIFWSFSIVHLLNYHAPMKSSLLTNLNFM